MSEYVKHAILDEDFHKRARETWDQLPKVVLDKYDAAERAGLPTTKFEQLAEDAEAKGEVKFVVYRSVKYFRPEDIKTILLERINNLFELDDITS